MLCRSPHTSHVQCIVSAAWCTNLPPLLPSYMNTVSSFHILHTLPSCTQSPAAGLDCTIPGQHNMMLCARRGARRGTQDAGRKTRGARRGTRRGTRGWLPRLINCVMLVVDFASPFLLFPWLIRGFAWRSAQLRVGIRVGSRGSSRGLAWCYAFVCVGVRVGPRGERHLWHYPRGCCSHSRAWR